MVEIKEYRGLIRNHVALAKELGVDIKDLDRRDREEALIIAAWNKWKVNLGNHINGQFTIVLHDDDTEETFLIQDVLGAEPLYYAMMNNCNENVEKNYNSH